MKNIFLALLILSIILFSFPVFSQTENDTTALGLPGDNLSLAAVLDLFQKSKTIEDFEKSLNDEKTGINNIDLNLDEKVDFIKVTTVQKDNDFTFILQVDVAEKETQDVAVILVSKDKNDKVTMQIVGDEDLYGEDYVMEPKPPVTPNPGYTSNEPGVVNVETPVTVVVVESAPIVQYVYSPVYVPYYPPYYYRYYPPYYAAFTVVAVGVYRHNHYYHSGYHGGYHGGHGNTVVIHNTNNYNNYNNSRNRSNTVNHNKANGNYNKNNVSNRQNKGTSTTDRSSNNMTKGTSNNRSSNNKGVSTTNKSSNNLSKGTSNTPKKSSTNMSKGTSKSSSNSMGSSRSKSGGSQGRGSGGGGRRR